MENNVCPLCNGVVVVEPGSMLGEDAPCPHCGGLLWFLRKQVGDVVVLTFLPGLITGSESVHRVDEVVSAIGDARRVVLNLSHLRFVASLFLGMLVVLHKRMASSNKELRICGVQPNAAVVFGVTKLDTVFSIHEDEMTAQEGF
jgi:anti-sigma B factor antagonist